MKFKLHPALTAFLLLISSPILAILIILFWLIVTVADIVLRVLMWPFKVLTGLIFSVLGGGK